MQLIDSRIGKEHFTCCIPVLVEINIELRSRTKAYLLIYSLLGVSAKTCTAIAGGFDDEEQVQWYMHAPIIFVWHLAKLSASVSVYLKWLLPPLTGAVRTPSRYKVNSSLPKAIRASQIVVSACDTFPVFNFPSDGTLLFKMPYQWVCLMAVETKLRKCFHMHNTAKLLQMNRHALSLNIQIHTNI